MTDGPGLLPHEGPVEGADAVGESGSLTAGPGVRVSFRFDDEVRVAAAGFETVSFPEAREPASRLCRALLGGTLAQVSALSIPDFALMCGLPVRSPAVRTVLFAKSAAILPHLGRAAHGGPALTCSCYHVPTLRIVEAIRGQRLSTVDEVRAATKAGSGCGCCRPDVQRLLDDEAGSD